MQTLWQDLRYAARMLLQKPAFALIAIMTLCLGIGANTAIFSVVNAVLLRPLPYRDPERIVAIQELSKGGDRIQVTPTNFLDWRAQNTVFAHLAAILQRTTNLAGATEAERVNLAVTSANFFEVFSVQPQEGRLFLPADEQVGHPAIAILSHRLWQRRFGGAAGIIGQSIILDGKSYTVVGVAPPEFEYPDKTEVWLPPLRLAPEINETADVTQLRGFGYLSAVARLKPEVSLRQAQVEMETITARLRQQYPETNNNRFNRVVLLHTHLVGETSTVLWLLLGAVGFVLLIACANVANLLLSRAAARQKEMAVRVALGASRWRLMRQLLTESTLLALTGGLFGLLLAWWGIDVLLKMLPKDFPRLESIGVDLTVLGFTLIGSLLTGIIFGLAPAWQVSRTDVHESLKESSRGTTGGRGTNHLRGALVVTEITLSLVLLVGAGLLFRSFLHLQAVNLGFDPRSVLTMRLSPSGTNFRRDEQYIAFYRQVIERLIAQPGVEAVGAINTLPLSKGPTFHFRVEGRPLLSIDRWPAANYRNVTPDYFRTLKIPIVQGRAFSERDDGSTSLVAIINQAAAERNFVGEDPVGKRLNFGNTDRNRQPIWFEIVGVAANVRSLELNKEPEPEIYLAAQQDAFSSMSFVIRTSVDPASLTSAVRKAVQEIDRAQPVSNLRTMEEIVSDVVAQPRFNLTLLGIFGGIALLLSAVGVYGVMSYSVTQRTNEIGIRMALGATGSAVLKLVLRQGMMLTLFGATLGLIASLALTRLMKTLLFGVSATDPLTFILITLLLTVVALLACLIPARRAAMVDPMVALRCE